MKRGGRSKKGSMKEQRITQDKGEKRKRIIRKGK